MSLIFFCQSHFPVIRLARDRELTMPCRRSGFLSLEPRRFGDFWGFLAGWWELVRLVPSRRSYAYSSPIIWPYFSPASPAGALIVSFALVAGIASVNILAIQMVAKPPPSSNIHLYPVIAMVVLAWPMDHNPFVPLVPPISLFPRYLEWPGTDHRGLLRIRAVSSVPRMWKNPQRSYPRGSLWVIPLSIAAYFLPSLPG